MKCSAEEAVGNTYKPQCESAVSVDQVSLYPLWGQISHALHWLLDTAVEVSPLMVHAETNPGDMLKEIWPGVKFCIWSYLKTAYLFC